MVQCDQHQLIPARRLHRALNETFWPASKAIVLSQQLCCLQNDWKQDVLPRGNSQKADVFSDYALLCASMGGYGLFGLHQLLSFDCFLVRQLSMLAR